MFPLMHFISPALDLMPCLPSQHREGGNNGIKSRKGAMKCCKENKITAPILMCGKYKFSMGLFYKMDSRRDKQITILSFQKFCFQARKYVVSDKFCGKTLFK